MVLKYYKEGKERLNYFIINNSVEGTNNLDKLCDARALNSNAISVLTYINISRQVSIDIQVAFPWVEVGDLFLFTLT